MIPKSVQDAFSAWDLVKRAAQTFGISRYDYCYNWIKNVYGVVEAQKVERWLP